VLDVHGGDDIDSRAEDVQDVLPAFEVPAGSRNVGVGQLVDQCDLGPSSQHRVQVHLFQAGSPVVDCLAGDDLEAVEQGLGVRPTVGLDESDDDVGAPAAPALALGEHGVGLADARGRAQVDAEWTGRLDLSGGICVRLRGAADAFAGLLEARAPGLLGDLGGLPPPGSALVRAGRLDAVTGFLITSRPLSIVAVSPAVHHVRAARGWVGSEQARTAGMRRFQRIASGWAPLPGGPT
jgi:hypothetical protein